MKIFCNQNGADFTANPYVGRGALETLPMAQAPDRR
jgi:hypothetical protein